MKMYIATVALAVDYPEQVAGEVFDVLDRLRGKVEQRSGTRRAGDALAAAVVDLLLLCDKAHLQVGDTYQIDVSAGDNREQT